MPTIVKRTPEEIEKRLLRNTFGDLNNPNIEGVDIDIVQKYYPELLKGMITKPKKINERDFYHHVQDIRKMSKEDQDKYAKTLGDKFDDKEDLVKYIRSILPEDMDKGPLINNVYLEKKGFKTKNDIDKYIKDNNMLKLSPSNKKMIRDIKKMIKEIPHIKTHSTSDDVLKTLFNVMDTKIPTFKKHQTSDSIIKTIFNVIDTKLPSKIDTKKGSDLIEKLESKLKKPKSEPKTLIDRLADSITNHPEFDNINKQKIEKYSFEIVNSFNKKYPKLMKHLFKTKENINALLLKKSDNAQKRELSKEKEKARKQLYSEKAKSKRVEKKAKKYKHFDDMTDAELKKFKQARDYYMRKSKTSTILPKNLNKEDPEGLNNVCKALAEKGFDTMSEHLFMSEYDGSTGSGIRKRKMRGGTLNGHERPLPESHPDLEPDSDKGSGGESDTEELIYDEFLEHPEPVEPDNQDRSSKAEHRREIGNIFDNKDILISTGRVTDSGIKEFVKNQKTDPDTLIKVYNELAESIQMNKTPKNNSTLQNLRFINGHFQTPDDIEEDGAELLALMISAMNRLYKASRKKSLNRMIESDKKMNKRKRDDHDPNGGHAYNPIMG